MRLGKTRRGGLRARVALRAAMLGLLCLALLLSGCGQAIPTLMRTHMYAASYTNFDQARYALNSIPPNAGLKACSSCVTCSARCARNVRIGDNIAELKTIYT